MNRIHPLSVLLGLALAALCFVTMAQTPVISPAAIRIEYMPHPRDMVQIQEGVPFVVSQNRIFVLTALGSTIFQGAHLDVNGVQCLNAYVYGSGGMTANSVTSVPAGFTVAAGSTVTVTGLSPTTGRAWGYLSGL